MNFRKYRKIIWLIGGIIFLLVLLSALTGTIVKYLWLHQLGYDQIFWKIKFAQAGLFTGTFAVALIYLGINIRYLTKNLKPIYLDLGQTPTGQANILNISIKSLKRIFWLGGLLISLFFAMEISGNWDEWFRFAHSKPFGLTDPVFGLENSFYVFKLPFIETVQNFLVSIAFIVVLFSTIYHFSTKGIALPNSKTGFNFFMNRHALKQIFINLSLWLLFLACGYYLDRYHLVFKHNSLIDGANYTDIHVRIPAYWIMTFGCIVLSGYAWLQIKKFNSRRFILSGIGLFVLGFLVLIVWPGMTQSYEVRPNEFNMEQPYLVKNIEFTRKAYDLNKVATESYNAADSATFDQIMRHKEATQNIRIWDQNLTVQTYKQLQEIRSYYEFYNIDLDRYHTEKGYRQVLISTRELAETLPPKAQTWVNSHLQYTHGSGIVMSPTTQKSPEGNPIFYIKDIPPRSDIGININQPAIYYGESKSDYKLVNTAISEMDYPKGDDNVYTHYKGNGGLSISGFWSKLLFAWYFGDINLLLTNYLHKDSRIQFWRDINTRVEEIAPFLKYDNDPYIVTDSGRLFWMHDGYTTASRYPYSEPYEGTQNYIRNSVKIVIDAYNGDVSFYVANPEDPVIQIYREVFPKVFKSLDEMPGDLKQHIKYPKDLFLVQLEKYSVYHMTDPRVFYNKEDLWTRPTETYGGKDIEMVPYYVLSTLPNSAQLQYMLICPMTPKNRDNMISWMVVKSDFPGYGQILSYELPKESLFLGPAQIEAKINQNTEISRQISLWDQKGSKVIRGNLMVIPIENSFLYVEPVFLFSTSVNIPQLKRVIATTGTNVVMEPTLEDALYALYGQVKPTDGGGPVSLVSNPAQSPVANLPSPELTRVRALWGDLQQAMKNQDWKTVGQKMDAINRILGDSGGADEED